MWSRLESAKIISLAFLSMVFGLKILVVSSRKWLVFILCFIRMIVLVGLNLTGLSSILFLPRIWWPWKGPFLEDDIYGMLKEMSGYKAPRQDGFTISFFQNVGVSSKGIF